MRKRINELEQATAVQASRERGVVKFFNDVKGWGFIDSESGEVFVHYSAIKMDGRKTLCQGDTVEFDISNGPKGPAAENVVVIPDLPSVQ